MYKTHGRSGLWNLIPEGSDHGAKPWGQDPVPAADIAQLLSVGPVPSVELVGSQIFHSLMGESHMFSGPILAWMGMSRGLPYL